MKNLYLTVKSDLRFPLEEIILIIHNNFALIIDKSNHKEGIKLMKITIIFIIFDVFLTFAAMDRARGCEKEIPPSNKFEELLDTYFDSNYLNNMFNNRWNRK